jgi:hypothetical protein
MVATSLQADPALRRFDDVRELIGSPANPTPLVRLNRVLPDGAFQLYPNLEWFSARNVPESAANDGHEVLSLGREQAPWRVVIRKVK